MKKYLTWGAGPRACQALLLGGKAHALLDGRVHVSTDDIRYVARPVLRHRLATSFRAESDGVTPTTSSRSCSRKCANRWRNKLYGEPRAKRPQG